VDSDFVVDLDKRRSLTGYMFTIGGCAVSWKATCNQLLIHLLLKLNTWLLLKHKACKEHVWLKGLLVEIYGDASFINLFCDNKNISYLTKNQIFHDKLSMSGTIMRSNQTSKL
jgi:ATP-binding cassette subfamily B (MDR/TAP) protein 1